MLLLPSVSNACIRQTFGGSPSSNSLVVVKISILLIVSTKTSLRKIILVTKEITTLNKFVTF